VKATSSGKTPYVRFDLNDYSIPHDYVGRALTLIASEHEVRIVDGGGEVLGRHARSYDRGQIVEDAQHILALSIEKRRAHELRGRDRLRSACPSADAFLAALAARGEALGSQTVRLLRLLERDGAAAVDSAMADAHRRGALSAASVAHVLEQRARARRTPPPITVIMPDDARLRDVQVTQHALGPYDALSADPEDPDDAV
jgi:hypothetical protein